MAVSGDGRRLWRKRGEGQLLLIVSEDFRTCVPLSRYKPPTNASHTHRPHSLSDAAAGLAAHYFQDVAPEHQLGTACVRPCVSVCVSTGVLSNSVSAVKSASVCVSASPKPDCAPVARWNECGPQTWTAGICSQLNSQSPSCNPAWTALRNCFVCRPARD
jgi:hypothetical protein